MFLYQNKYSCTKAEKIQDEIPLRIGDRMDKGRRTRDGGGRKSSRDGNV